MNKLRGKIKTIETDNELSMVKIEVENTLFSSIIIGTPETLSYLSIDFPVFIAFNETEMSIGKGLTGKISLKNEFDSIITGIAVGKLLSEIELDFRGHKLKSIITSSSTMNLNLAIGDMVTGYVKSTDLSIIEIESI